MKIRSARVDNRKRAFEIVTWRETYLFPYGKADPAPSGADPVVSVIVDQELGREAITYKLASGAEGVVHIDQALDYNQDPRYMRDLLLHKLTVEALRCLEASPLSKREIIRRLRTSPAQFYRLIDPTNYGKSLDQMLRLLQALDCEVDLIVRARA